MEPAEILELFGKRATIIKPGLSRVTAALDILGSPSRNTPTIIVAGTNGKGSTCGFLFRLLAASGVRAGLFSSPHLIEFRERITVSDIEVTNEIITREITNLKELLPDSLWQELTFFEINTILAACVFQNCKTDVNILEVGLGGRLDSVNVYDADVAVITSIGLDHQEYLGHSHADIAKEKAGIMRPGKPVVWSGLSCNTEEADHTIKECAREIGAKVLIPADIEWERLPALIRNYPSFLRRNFSMAVAGFGALVKTGRCAGLAGDMTNVAMSRFDENSLPWPVTLTGRFERVTVHKGQESRELVIDVCHNPHGAKALKSALEETGVLPPGVAAPCLISILSDKDVSGIWDEIRCKIRDVVRFRISSSRSWDENDHRIGGPMLESFEQAWHAALRREDWRDQNPWLIFGSVAAVGEALAFLRRDGWSMVRKVRD